LPSWVVAPGDLMVCRLVGFLLFISWAKMAWRIGAGESMTTKIDSALRG